MSARAVTPRCLALSVGICMLTACAAVPLSTMRKMRDMTVDRFFASDPQQLRVAIRTDDTTRRGSEQPRMRIEIDAPGTKPICYAFPLDPIAVDAPGEARLEAAGRNRRWYAFGLSRKGVDVFQRARREARNMKAGEYRIAFDVAMTDVLVPAETARSLPIRIDLQLNRTDGYFTMTNEMNVAITRDAERPAMSATATRSAPPTTDRQAKPACLPAA